MEVTVALDARCAVIPDGSVRLGIRRKPQINRTQVPTGQRMKRRVPNIRPAFELLRWRPSRTLDEIILEMVPLLPGTENGRRKLAAQGAERSPMVCAVQRGC